MVVVGMIAALVAALALPAAAQPETDQYLALQYAVRVSNGSVGAIDITPRYLWLDDHRLVVPIREVVEAHDIEPDLQNIDLFVLDFTVGTAVRVASYDEVFGVTLIPTEDGGRLFLSVIVAMLPRGEVDFMNRRVRERYAMNTATFAITPTTLETIQQERAAIQPGARRPYPDTLSRITTNDLYNHTAGQAARGRRAYDWEQWGEYIVAMGELDGDWYTDPRDLRLYRADGSTAYVLPNIGVYQEYLRNSLTHLQVSPGGRFLFLNEQYADRSALRILRQYSVRSMIYIYGFVEEDPTEYYDTVVYIMDNEDFGAGYEIGEVFEVEREIVDGSGLSTGPVVEPVAER